MSVFHPTLALDDLPEGRGMALDVAGRDVLLVRLGAEVHALENRCAHAGTRFDNVRAVNQTIICPMHGARFDLRTGRCVNAPYEAIAAYPVRIRDGVVEVALDVADP